MIITKNRDREGKGLTTRERVAAIRWYHSIPIGDHVTPGERLLSQEEWISTILPADLAGKSVLDVGAWDGYFSFEAERRGAQRVLAIDSLQGWHFDVGLAGFECARDLLGSKRVEYKVMNVLDIDRLQERFDVILFFGVYYHMVDPVRAFELMRDQLAPGGQLLIEGLVMAGSQPNLRLLNADEIEPTTFCAPTVSWLRMCLSQLGFRIVEMVGVTADISTSLRYYRDYRPSFLGGSHSHSAVMRSGCSVFTGCLAESSRASAS